MVKDNPMVAGDEEKLENMLKERMNMKKYLAKQSFSFIFFGLFMASTIFVADSQAVIASVLTSIALIPLILSIYMTTIQSSYLVSLNLFEPLKSVPVKVGNYYLSALITLDLLPAFAIVLPSIIVVMIRYPLSGILALAWVVVGSFAGHTIGLFIFSYFGLKVTHKRGKMNTLKNILKIIGMILFMGLFFSLIYLQDYIIARSDIITSYPFVYPLSIASVFDHIQSLLFLGLHLLILLPVYRLFLKRTWNDMMEPSVVSQGKKDSTFTPSVRNPIISLFKKDLKMISRKTSMLAGFLFPLYVIIPQIFIGAQDGIITMTESTMFVFILGVLTTAGADAILKIEGDSLNFLKRLPIGKGSFATSKALSMSVVPGALTTVLVGVAVYYNGITGLLLAPYMILLPITSSLATMTYLFNYRGDRIGLPEFGFKKMILLFIIVGSIFGIVIAPIFIFFSILRYLLSYLISVLLILILYKRLNR